MQFKKLPGNFWRLCLATDHQETFDPRNPEDMAENTVDQIVADLRATAPKHYPHMGELRNIRVVGHTPKTDHFIYDIVADFHEGSERIAAKVYRANKCVSIGARALAKREFENLSRVYAIFDKKKLDGVPRPLGDYTDLGAVVAEKISGLPLQSIIMKAALLPGFADRALLNEAARQAGEWLRSFHKATSDMPSPFDPDSLIADLEKVCESCRSEGLDEPSIRAIVKGARSVLARTKKTLGSSAVLNEFTPLNIVVREKGIGICDYAKMETRGVSLNDAAMFLASVEALEKYPFCDRNITSEVQSNFLDAYGVGQAEQAILRVLKMKTLLAMFAQGRNIKESAVRKRVMWANVMKKFIHQAAQRSLAPAA